jgi:hypothetical protein
VIYEIPQYDEKLWITVSNCCSSKHYLLSNPHTFPGRISVWCPRQQLAFRVSKSEIETCSLEAEYWIKGFLVGNEPDAPTDEQGDYLPDDDPRMIRWRAALRQFPETGLWVVSERLCEQCGEILLPTQPGMICAKCQSSE